MADSLPVFCHPALLAAVRAAIADMPSGAGIGVALSAGADSAMLALHAAQVAKEQGRALHCFHIHHGLQREADDWLARAHALAGLLKASCHSRKVCVEISGAGMEAAARHVRYEALADLAGAAGLSYVLLAHHQDDQAETVLLRLLRGSGPGGLAAMAPGVVRDGIHYLRPWLDQPRRRILRCADQFTAATGWIPAQDPSNADSRYKRGAVRTALAPILDEHWPAWRRNLARHARQAALETCWADQQLGALWAQLDPTPDGTDFSLAAWRALSPESQVVVLRGWLKRHGLRAPTEARLNAWLRQLRGVHALGHDRHVWLPHEGAVITVKRGRVQLIRETYVE